MKPQPRKGQTSLDFLMTYGWAVLLVVVVVASLFALGIFNAGSFMGPRATGFSQIGVIAWNVNAAGILSLKLQNFAGMDINVINIEATYGTSHYSYDITNVSIPNSKISDTFTVGAIGGLTPGQYYTLPLRITYIDLNGFNYTETGTISGTVGAGAVPPSIRINSPHSNSLLNNRTINISVSVWGANLSQTDIMIIDSSGTPVNVTTNSQLGTYAVELSVDADGVYNITALANYTDGGSASATASNITVNISAPASLQCGDPLDIQDHIYTLSDDVSSGGTCFTIGADNVTLDCNGHSITGSGSDDGVNAAGHSNVTVKNCVITGFTYGIEFNGASYGTIENNTVSDYDGLILFSSSDINIINNNVSSNHNGIYLSSSNHNNITNNTANSNEYAGIYLGSCSNNAIYNNTVDSNNRGIEVDSGQNNSVTNNDAGSNTVGIQSSDSHGTIANNTIGLSGYYGIYLTGGSNITIANNTVGSSGAYGIYSGTSGNTIFNNLFNNTNNAYLSGSNIWNTTLSCDVPGITNIIGGNCTGGNFWATPDDNGWSQNSTECNANSSGICTWQYNITSSNIDYLPLTNLTPAAPPELPYIYSAGEKLYIHPTDNAFAAWGCFGTNTGASSTTNGSANTAAIVANGCSTEGIAAKLCSESTFGGYSDWYLPATDQLYTMYTQRDNVTEGDYASEWVNFTASHYWSSTEYSGYQPENFAWFTGFGLAGYQGNAGKSSTFYVRCVRG